MRDAPAPSAQTMVAVLGAGTGSRMGGEKLGKYLGGRPLGMWALSAAQSLEATVLFIAPPQAPTWLDSSRQDVEVITNPQAASGMASSLMLAADVAMQRHALRLLVMLADMPFVSTKTLSALLDQTLAGEAKACRYPDGHLGPPACFGKQRLPALAALSGDAGARYLLNQPGFAKGVEVATKELLDVDTVEDLESAACLIRRPGQAIG